MVKRGKSAFAASLGLTSTPFYIGKGTGDRAYNINRSETHRKIKQKINAAEKEVEVVILKDNLSELKALCYESKLLDIFGLIPHKGWLSNLDEGYLKEDRRNNYMEEYKILCPNAISKWNMSV